jgi:hypothetical protein
MAAMSECPKHRKIEDMISDFEKRVNTLETRTENHGPEDLFDREEDSDNLTDDIATLDRLLAAVQARHDALPT